jgi:ketosteroid isomerase-like protein
VRSEKALFRLGAAVLLLTTLSMQGYAQTMTDDERLIREARAANNRAIAAHDADAMAGQWMPNFHITSSTGTLRGGREENRASLAQLFQDRPDVRYVRTPDVIQLLGSWDVAGESGHWTGQWTHTDGVVRVGGDYYAQWRKVDGRWLIQAEIFVPTHCAGSSYCDKRP